MEESLVSPHRLVFTGRISIGTIGAERSNRKPIPGLIKNSNGLMFLHQLSWDRSTPLLANLLEPKELALEVWMVLLLLLLLFWR